MSAQKLFIVILRIVFISCLQELIARVKASTENDVDNGLAGWVCRECLEGTGISRNIRPVETPGPVTAQRPAVQPSNRTTSDSQSLPLRVPPAKKDSAAKVLKYKQTAARPLEHNKRPERIPSSRSDNASSSKPGSAANAARIGDVSRVNATTKKLPTLDFQASRVPHTGHVAEQARREHSDTSRQAPRVDLQHARRPSPQTKVTNDDRTGKPPGSSPVISSIHQPPSSGGPVHSSQAQILAVDARKFLSVCLSPFLSSHGGKHFLT
jgi:hypothetical protein